MTEEEIQQKIKDLESRLSEHDDKLKKVDTLEYRMNMHKHTGSDLTDELAIPTQYTPQQYNSTNNYTTSITTTHTTVFKPQVLTVYGYFTDTVDTPTTWTVSGGTATQGTTGVLWSHYTDSGGTTYSNVYTGGVAAVATATSVTNYVTVSNWTDNSVEVLVYLDTNYSLKLFVIITG